MIRLRWAAYLLFVVLAIIPAGCSSSSNQPNPTPIIGCMSGTVLIPACGLVPPSITAGSQQFTLAVLGQGFISGSSGKSVINWNGTALPTTFSTVTLQLTAPIPASFVAQAGQAQITVTNPAPGGGSSASVSLIINAPAANGPVISSVSPQMVNSGGKRRCRK